MFGFFEKKNRVTDDVVLKRMPAVKGDFEGLRLDEDTDQPQDLHVISTVQNTIRGQSTQVRLVPCKATVKVLLVQIRKGQAEVYYVTPRPFAVECRDGEGALVRYTAKFDVGLPQFATWLQLCVRTPGENVTAERLAAWLDGKALPSWLTVVDSERIAEPPPARAPEPERTGAAALVPGAVVFDRYHIECELGEGGMGKVFLATDTATTIEARRKVVLKVLHIENAHDLKAQEQFKKEAETLADLRNDRIAACYNSRMFGDVPILVMEYVEGVSLDKYLAEREGALDEATTKALLLPIAEALDYAHAKNICHLDVKPQNIIVRKTPKAGIKTCLLDFGIARRAHTDGTLTYTMSVSGTRQYMSPEQWNKEPFSPGMDVYSLAVTAYECVMGELPFKDGWKKSELAAVKQIGSGTRFAEAVMRTIFRTGNCPATCVQLIGQPQESGRGERAKGRDVGAEVRPDQVRTDRPPSLASHALEGLRKSIEVFRQMLAQSANKIAMADAERAAWLRDRQARLRDLTVDLASANEEELADFFRDIKSRLVAARSTPDDFFAATDRLVELRAGLPKAGGAAWREICASVR